MSWETLVVEDGLSIVRMRDLADYQLMTTWRNLPHVRQWWDPDDPPMDVDGARKEYGPEVSGRGRMRCGRVPWRFVA